MNKYEIALQRGYTYDKETGFVYGPSGNRLKRISKSYYTFNIKIDDKRYNIFHHRFAWYYIYGEIDDNLLIDHINRVKTDNRLSNLRLVTHQENNFNKVVKGAYEIKRKNDVVYISKIKIGSKSIHLGTFHTEKEARKAYDEAKKKLHKIKNPVNRN